MALPMLAGIPWLASVLGALFGGLVSFFGKYLTRRLAMVTAAVAAIGALSATFFAALNTLIGSLTLAVPAPLAGFLGHVIPSNLALTMSVLFSAHVARWAYEWNVKVVQLKLF